MQRYRIQRMTRQRRVIREELRKLTAHPTADEVYAAVRRRLPRISLGTVYRNLNVMARCGMIGKLTMGGAQCRFDGDPKTHCHVRCVACERVANVGGDPVSTERVRSVDLEGYDVLGYRLEFYGVCPACRRKQGEQEALAEQERG